MLLLRFRTGDSHYGIDARKVVEVVPRVHFRPLPHAPDFLRGHVEYRGRVVPVVDFTRLVGQETCREVMSSRVILLEFTTEAGHTHLVGLLAESVSRLENVREEQFVAPPMRLEGARYLGAIYTAKEGLVQIVVTDKLLSGPLQNELFGTVEGVG